jgi:hypothetical protein
MDGLLKRYLSRQGWRNGSATGAPAQIWSPADNKSLLNKYYNLENITLLIKI